MKRSTISLVPFQLQKAPEGKEKCFVRGGRGRAELCAAGRTGEEADIPEGTQRLPLPFPVPPESTEHDCPEGLCRAGGRRGSGCSAQWGRAPGSACTFPSALAGSSGLCASVSLRPEVTLMTRSFPILPVNPQRGLLYKHRVLLVGSAMTTLGRATPGTSQHRAGNCGWVAVGNTLPCRRLLKLH